MNEVKLNLARKWRSKQFEEIVGQDLSVRMLKNSLYLQQYFPVYLFSGQRGCGKTTTARVFAASLNCEQLEDFQKKPQEHRVPCLQCASCKAMERGNHPDFIEIDAASHTGVDNVRMLIESASLLPVMGRKKIYLIDEAHMLSKAAFNAFLKILEEPPMSVIFILATTDPQKIIETVHSRCFQLFFRPIDIEVLHARLREVCQKEQIAYDDAGLALITKQTEGSARDALNLLEQVRFSSKAVTQDAVLQILGHMPDQMLIDIFETVVTLSPVKLLQKIETTQWARYSAQLIWVRLLELIRASLWLKHGVNPELFSDYHARLKKIVHGCTAHDLMHFLQQMYDQEILFSKTSAKHEFLEMVLLQLCHYFNRSRGDRDDDNGSSTPLQAADTIYQETTIKNDLIDDEELEQEEDQEESDEDDELAPDTLEVRQKRFISSLTVLDDQIMQTIFTHGIFKQATNEQGTVVIIELSRQFSFFDTILEQTKKLWLPLLQAQFGSQATVQLLFTGEPIKRTVPAAPVQPRVVQQAPSVEKPAPRPAPAVQQNPYAQKYQKAGGQKFTKQLFNPFGAQSAIDVSDATIWPKVQMIMRHFAGTVTALRENGHEK